MVDLNVTSMHIKNPSTGEWDEISIIAGKSAYQSAVDGGYQGTEAEFNAALANGGTADALPLAGGTMSGNINMDSNKVTNLPTPTANSDAVPKSYTDNIVAVSDTQPTATENKLWVDTDAGSGASYQVPTVAEMEAADAQLVNYKEYTLTKLSTATNWTIIRYHACKLGKIAFLQIVASVTANQDSSGVRIFALPQDLWPRYGVETRVTSAEFAMDVNVNITVEGNMAFTRGGSTAGNIRMDFCYPTN